jgi:murein DD-endopeptidase MepM/ murein hydrolase activator NlpD
MDRHYYKIFLNTIIIIVACTNCTPEISLPPTITQFFTPSNITAATASPIPSHQPTVTKQGSTKTPIVETDFCSPLKDIPYHDAPSFVTNKYSPPEPGSDNPHQGIDLSILDNVMGIAVGGNTVQAMIDGQVAAIIIDRFPYGNAVIIETHIDVLPEPFPKSSPDPTMILSPRVNSLTCPEEETSSKVNQIRNNSRDEKSLYLIYAHLELPPEFQIGDPVKCGQTIGKIGSSGNAINPHLHLEARVGPTGVWFSSMSHYNTDASLKEMANYCIWRTSGLFRPINPLLLFQK